MSILAQFNLKGAQIAAAERLDVHLAVTAGAGSGKTRALVGRYLHFVEQGAPLRSLIAITFTEKAAREMRFRIRREIEQWLATPSPTAHFREGEGVGVWQQAFIDLDSARIGTIHSLCADLLRLYPVEAGVDPRFTVLEEGRAALLQAEAVGSALTWAANERDVVRLFAAFKENELRRQLNTLLLKRLDAAPLLHQPDSLTRWEAELTNWLDARVSSATWVNSLTALAECSSPKSDDKLELARRAVLTQWHAFQIARAASDWDATFAALRELRGVISTGGLKGNWDSAELETVREAMKTLRDDYDTHLKPILKDETRWELDQQAAALLPALCRLFDRALAEYQFLKDQSLALDFDDLEDRATRLLNSPLPTAPFAAGAQAGVGGEGVRAILIDEFQDTNDRQRQIVYALAGFDSPLPAGEGPGVRENPTPANLFIVGDAKQGIYRFRGADVTVFRNIQTDIVRLGGEKIDLDLTFRAHEPLLQTVEQLLSPLMGMTDDPARPYHVPFASLTAHRVQPRDGVRAPFVEFQLGLGDDADAGRRAAAQALAARLHELRAQEGFAWEEMALLFRASTAFPIYEDALETAGIPFVTVAGKGFYDRPEIRDLLNALTVIADPSDDLALAGLLRSPAFALTDADLYHLRFSNDGAPHHLFQSLREASNPHFAQAAEMVTRLHSLSGRLPVAELLKHFLDVTHYRAILKAGGSTRLSRNVDKLLADAHRSRLVAVDDFLEYVQALRDVGAREGEAPADPSTGSGGAVQLMTVHKSKGLEFPLVVIADAAHNSHGSGGDNVQLNPELGVLLKLTDHAAQPAAWQLGALADEDRAASEDLRLLYVAATRAQDKLLVNGHAKISAAKSDPGKLTLAGWLKQLGGVIGLDDVRLKAKPPEVTRVLDLGTAWAAALRVTTYAQPPAPEAAARPEAVVDEAPMAAVPGPLSAPLNVAQASIEVEARDRVWRVITGGRSAPAWVVGKLTHEALRRWTFVDLETRLRPVALDAGLTEASAIGEALRETRRLLERFRAHSLFREMDEAAARHHELPYVLGGDAGVIDVLYRAADGWVVADFKTDDLRDEPALARVLPEYRAQLRRYAEAVTAQLHLPAPPRAQLIFLNWRSEVRVVGLEANLG